MVLDDVIQVLSLGTVTISLYLVFSQTRKLQKQVTIANLFSRYEALNNASERYDTALALIFEHPGLRPYVFEERPLDLRDDDLARALTVADLMAGAADYALRVGARFPDDLRSDWGAVASRMARQPLFRAIMAEQPHQFPDLIRYFSPAAPDDEGVRRETRDPAGGD